MNPSDLNTPNKRLKWARERKFRHAVDFCRAHGLVVTTYRGHEDDKNIPQYQVELYAKLLAVPAAWISYGGALNAEKNQAPTITDEVYNAVMNAEWPLKPDETPVAHTPVFAYHPETGKEIQWATSAAIDWTALSLKFSAAGLVILEIQTDHYAPRYRHGERVVLSRQIPLVAGKDCFIQPQSGSGFFAKFRAENKKAFSLEAFKPAKELELALHEVSVIWSVVARI